MALPQVIPIETIAYHAYIQQCQDTSSTASPDSITTLELIGSYC